jgi:cyclophilin family peptidyl-prolyl cis-trans isomerase
MFKHGIYNEKESAVSKKENKLPEFDIKNPQVYMDIEIGEQGSEDHHKDRVVFELFQNKTPKTAENFRCLCTGEKGSDIHYLNNVFHRVIPGFMMQGGDITEQNGTGGKSIYGHKFPDEKVWLPHTHGGLLSMANSGPDTNGSQFFVCFKATPWLDGKHTCFGRVISGMGICRKAEAVKTGAQDKPLTQIKIVGCGELTEKLAKE